MSGNSATVGVLIDGVMVYEAPVYSGGLITETPRVVDIGDRFIDISKVQLTLDVTEVTARELLVNTIYAYAAKFAIPPHITTQEEIDNVAIKVNTPRSTDTVLDVTLDCGGAYNNCQATGIVKYNPDGYSYNHQPNHKVSIDDVSYNYKMPTYSEIVPTDNVCLDTATMERYDPHIQVPIELVNPKIDVIDGLFNLKFKGLQSNIIPLNYREEAVLVGEFISDSLKDVKDFVENYISYSERMM